MDKNKSRADLLSAGRKKLQQFRQKKDSKGNSSYGKSAKNSNKSEQNNQESDTDATSVTAKSTTLQQVAEGEIASPNDSSLGNVDTSVSHSVENSANPDVDNEYTLAQEGGIHVKDIHSTETNAGEKIQSIDNEVTVVVPLEISDISNSEEETKRDDAFVSVNLLATSDIVDVTDGIAVTVEMESTSREGGKELLQSQEDVPDVSLIPARGDLVTDEADGLGAEQFGGSNAEAKTYGQLSLSEHGENVEPAGLEQIGLDKAPTQMKQIDGPDGVHAVSSGIDPSDEFLASISSDSKADGSPGVFHEVINQGEVDACPSDVEAMKLTYQFGGGNDMEDDGRTDNISAETSNQHYMPEESFVFVGKTHERMMSLNSLESCTMTPLVDVCSISFVQLVEAIKGLSEDEYRLLLKSRGSLPGAEIGTDSMGSTHHHLLVLLERVKEELFLADCTKEIFHLQLTEQSELQTGYDREFYRLSDEISRLQTSFKEASERSDHLAEELAECRSELQATVGEREEVQHQFDTAKAEVEEVSARANELQNSLESSQSDLLSLLKEFTDCKDMVAALQDENKNLTGTLVSLTEERKELVEEIDSCLHNNEKLLMELADSKNLLAAVQVENLKSSEAIASGMEEMKKLEEQKEYLANKNEMLYMELSNCKVSVESLQVENANFSRNLTEERNKVEEDKKLFVQENQRLLSELLVLNESLSEVHGERERLEVELKQVTMQLEQLIEENIFLNSSLDIRNAKIKELDEQQAQILSQVMEPVIQVGNVDTQRRGYENAADIEHPHLVLARQDTEATSYMLEESTSGPTSQLFEQKVIDDSFGLLGLRGRLLELEKIRQKLKRAVNGMHSDSESLCRSGDTLTTPAVSKLIHTFESKQHNNQHEAVEAALADNQHPSANPFASAKECMGSLKEVLKQLTLDAEIASMAYKEEQTGRSDANLTIRDLQVQCEALEEHTDHLEGTDIQLMVLYEAVKQQLLIAEERNNELGVLYETLKEQDSSLKAENCELGETLSESRIRIGALQSKLHELRNSSYEMASMLRGQLDGFQKDASELVLTVEKEWNSVAAQIVEAVERLDELTGFLFSSAITTGSHGSLGITYRVTASINAAVEAIIDKKKKLEAVRADHEATLNLFKEVNEKCNELVGKDELANDMLQKLYGDLRKLVTDFCGSMEQTEVMIAEEFPEPVDYSRYRTLTGQLENYLTKMLELQLINNELNLELTSRTKDVDELNRTLISIQKLVEDVEGVEKLENTDPNSERMPFSHLESLMSVIVRKYKEADEQAITSREDFESKLLEFTGLQENMLHLTALNDQHKNEILLLKEHLSKTEEALVACRSELQEKVSELEQSEQRVSSIREKLSLAVTKGKGLVVQRDSLKQSLAEKSSELERCSQELQLKDARLHEVETKLKTYSEAGERVEALESELSYIRNSATALRESFLLKDSLLQRIEEILEDLDLPENFHSRGTIDKVDWLARSVTGSLAPPADWDQKSSAGASYSDAGFVIMDAWKEDAQPSSNSGFDDLKRKYEELQNKFYGLAEQNEMLEQSLMERYHLVQRWEELLDSINMPSPLRSSEPEDRIEWLGSALLEANRDRSSLLQKVDELEGYCESRTADLAESQKRISHLNSELVESQKRISELEMDLQAVTHERENLSERLETVALQHENASSNLVELEHEKEKLQIEVIDLQGKLIEKVQNEEHVKSIEAEISRLQNLVCDALQDAGARDFASDGSNTEHLEALLGNLIANYTSISSEKQVLRDGVEQRYGKADVDLVEARSTDLLNAEESVEMRTRDALDTGESDVAHLISKTVESEETNVAVLKKELEQTLGELINVKEERDRDIERQQSLIREVEALHRKGAELQELLNQEEQKSASVREKLNVAVRKGKSLVQQRDSLKHTIEDMNTELEQLKSEIKNREDAIAEYEQKTVALTTYSERVEALETESSILRNCLAQTEQYLNEKEHTLAVMLSSLGNVDVGNGNHTGDPIAKLEHIVKLCHDLHATVASSEQESKKSRKAAELLLAELNEVQDRNDSLQEELAKATAELAELSNKRDVAEAAKLEALSHLGKLSAVQSEERMKQYSEFTVLNSAANQLRKSLSDVNNSLAAIFSKDLEFLQSLEVGVESCLKTMEANLVVHVPSLGTSDDNTTCNSSNKNFHSGFSSQINLPYDDKFIAGVYSSVQACGEEVDALRKALDEHSVMRHRQATNLSNLIGILYREMVHQKESFEALQRDMRHIESIQKEKELEIGVLHRNIGLLYESCTSSLMEIGNKKAEVVGSLDAGDHGVNSNSSANRELVYGGENSFPSEEHIKSIAERLLFVVKDFASLKGEYGEDEKKEMRIMISNLQREIQDKDIQRERICMELVSQIKEAEASVASYLQDLKSSKACVRDLEKQVETLEVERTSLEHKIKTMQDEQAISTGLQEKVRSLSNVLAAKDQEIEALMQALDEEEVQMEDLSNKIQELEKVIQQKNLDTGNLEASRGKVLKKLSITMSKFDELHHFSESLVAEVEKLQSQLQERDAEISFLRQEVTRCTNDVIVASQMSSKSKSDEVCELLTWLDSLLPQDGMQYVKMDDYSQVCEFKEILKKKIASTLSELEDLRVAAQSRDALLKAERTKVEELMCREEILEKSLHEMESQLNMLEGVGDSGHSNVATSEILEVEPVINKWSVSTKSQVRSLRKVNNDQVAIAIDMDPGESSRLEDEDDDKVHGFKSLTTSRIVPKFTRPVSEMVDGLWVSCDRALMRQPALRLGIMIYWAVLHALLATFMI